MTKLTHLDSDGRARMVDVGDKAATARSATASGRFVTTPEVVTLMRADGLPKADVLATARIAGIQGAKRTSELIPLAHPIALSSVNLDFVFDENAVTVTATAKTTGKTGVEMEALTAVAVAGLTLHDMVKAIDPFATMTDLRLIEKTGGKRGHWTREGTQLPIAPRAKTVTIIVASTSSASGQNSDATGPIIVSWFAERGFATDLVVVSDEHVDAALTTALLDPPAVILTTGGTGISPTDRTPEATERVLDRELPGIAEAIRARGLTTTPTAAISRALVGVAGQTLVVNLPGSPGAVRDGLSVLEELLEHLLAQLAGAGSHG